ncbi:MAG: hypothetical protein A2X08_18310 [Bacteroidetes bacterium GWA2_32_17]|nr:MAG: hypothetical protein A2X08_18310 [Bacteroidetes bacterium GWA2_32_17]
MKKATNIYVQLMEKYLSFIDNLPIVEIVRLEKKEITISFNIVQSSKQNKTNKKPKELTLKAPIEVDLIISELYKINNRIEGENLLLSKCTKRFEWESVLKKLDVPFQKRDNIEKLKNKIIERTIGFRLRSQAIQGETK